LIQCKPNRTEELDLFLDPTTSGGKTSALFRQLRDALVSGCLAAGDRLPPTRDIDRLVGIRLSTSALADLDAALDTLLSEAAGKTAVAPRDRPSQDTDK
jgi:hypothetical protein